MNVNIISTSKYDYQVEIDGVGGCNISNGVRFVYRVGDYVIKFPNPEYGISYSHDELAVWNRIAEEDRKYFAPVLEQTDSYVVQPYVELSGHDADNAEAKETLRYLSDDDVQDSGNGRRGIDGPLGARAGAVSSSS